MAIFDESGRGATIENLAVGVDEVLLNMQSSVLRKEGPQRPSFRFSFSSGGSVRAAGHTPVDIPATSSTPSPPRLPWNWASP